MLTQQQIDFLRKHIKGIVWHWTAGGYNQTFDDYHFNITYDGKLAHVKQTKSIYEIGEHIWHRNTGLLGLSFCAMYTDPKTGKVICPVEDNQVEVMAKLTAELCCLLNLDPQGFYVGDVKKRVGNTLVNIGDKGSFPVLTDHAYYAKKDGYFPDRWDIGNLHDLVKRKTVWYYEKLKSGEHKFEYTVNIK